MGFIQSDFYTEQRQHVVVTFEGDNIEGEVTLASSPVVLQTVGDGDYSPVMYTTATINIVATDINVSQFFVSNPTAVRVSVDNKHTGANLFTGYVVPNTFNQQIDAYIGVVGIECADLLGIAKYVKYKMRNGNALTTLTLRETVVHLLSLLSPTASVAMADFVSISNGSATTTHYPELQVSEAYFFDSPTQPTALPDGSLSLAKNARTCYDVLAMIAESLRATWVQTGGRVILVDHLSLSQGSLRVFSLTATAGQYTTERAGSVRHIDEWSFSSGGNTMSARQRYELFSLSRTKLKELPILPAVLAEGLQAVGARVIDYTEGLGTPNYQVHLAQRLKSDFISIRTMWKGTYLQGYTDATATATPYPSAMIIGTKDIKPVGGWNVNAPEYYTKWDNSWSNMIRLYRHGVVENDTISGPAAYDEFICEVGIKKEFTLPVVASRNLCLAIELEVGSVQLNTVNTRYMIEPTTAFLNVVLGMLIKMGDYYYNSRTGVWTVESVVSSVEVFGDKWKSKVIVRTDGLPPGYLTTTTKGGTLEVAIRFRNAFSQSPAGNAEVIYIRNWQISLKPSMSCTMTEYYHPRKEVTYNNSNNIDNEYERVSPPITFGYPFTERNFGTVIEGVEYAPTEGSWDTDVDIKGEMHLCGEDMLARVESLANLGDGKEYTLNLRDLDNSMSCIDAYYSSLWQGAKIATEMQKDIEKNIVNVKLR